MCMCVLIMHVCTCECIVFRCVNCVCVCVYVCVQYVVHMCMSGHANICMLILHFYLEFVSLSLLMSLIVTLWLKVTHLQLCHNQIAYNIFITILPLECTY